MSRVWSKLNTYRGHRRPHVVGVRHARVEDLPGGDMGDARAGTAAGQQHRAGNHHDGKSHRFHQVNPLIGFNVLYQNPSAGKSRVQIMI